MSSWGQTQGLNGNRVPLSPVFGPDGPMVRPGRWNTKRIAQVARFRVIHVRPKMFRGDQEPRPPKRHRSARPPRTLHRFCCPSGGGWEAWSVAALAEAVRTSGGNLLYLRRGARGLSSGLIRQRSAWCRHGRPGLLNCEDRYRRYAPNSGSQTSKAYEGATPPRVQIPPPSPGHPRGDDLVLCVWSPARDQTSAT